MRLVLSCNRLPDASSDVIPYSELTWKNHLGRTVFRLHVSHTKSKFPVFWGQKSGGSPRLPSTYDDGHQSLKDPQGYVRTSFEESLGS